MSDHVRSWTWFRCSLFHIRELESDRRRDCTVYGLYVYRLRHRAYYTQLHKHWSHDSGIPRYMVHGLCVNDANRERDVQASSCWAPSLTRAHDDVAVDDLEGSGGGAAIARAGGGVGGRSSGLADL